MMVKIYFVQLSLAFLNVAIKVVSGRGGTAAHPFPCTLFAFNCSKTRECCPIPNGKAYCTVESGKCEAIRYCDASPTNCPFNDLSVEEVKDTIDIIVQSKSFGSKILFPIIRKQEPKKKDWISGGDAARHRVSYAAVLDFENEVLSEVTIDLNSKTLISNEKRPKSLAPATGYEYEKSKNIALNDARIIDGYKQRGLDMQYADVVLWAVGALGRVDGNLLKVVCFYKDPGTKYLDWRPVEGLQATVDVYAGKIIDLIDERNTPVPIAPKLSESVDDAPSSAHPGTSSHSSSIKVNGFIINWKDWKFQYSMDPVYGLQFYHIRYTADCEERLVIYKMAISEMFVPYGEQGNLWRWKAAFDAGEYGLGKSVSPIIKGHDVPADAIIFPCTKLDDLTGKVNTFDNCIALFEREEGSLYKHFDLNEQGKASTTLVAVFMAAIGNYDYLFEYVFKLDGVIDVGIYATGILHPKAVVQVKNDPTCIEDCKDFINENMIGPCHQHFFNYRIDFDIEGTNNVLLETDFVNDPEGPENPDEGAFSLRHIIIRKEAFRDFSIANSRSWTVINPQSRNKFNTPRGYSIHPSNIAFTFLKPGNPLNQALFITHPLWVTKFKDDEHGAAGTFPRSGISRQGLPNYIENVESVDNDDLVVWHTLGITHGPRAEEFPLMNVKRLGFMIVPRNFVSSNPVIPLDNQCGRK